MTTSARVSLASAGLLAAIVLLALSSLSYGQVSVPLGEVGGAIFGQGDPVFAQIVGEIRFPRVLTALIAGAALGLAGVMMQALFRNPMADAWSLGLVAGGQMGVALLVAAAAYAGPTALSFLAGLQGISLTVGAALGIALAAAAMGALAKRVGTITLLVVGLMIGFTAQGLVSVVMHFANRAGGRVYAGWADGNFASVTNSDLWLLAVPVAMGAVLALFNAKGLYALLLGDNYARSLGTDVARLRRMTLLAVVILVAPVTALCGPVTFVGLIVPHFARAMAGSARIMPLLLPAALSGALLALSADFILHLPWEEHYLHLNAVLAIIGAPIVIALLLFSKSMRGQG
jgi:iron complex transport system permease protein